MREYSKPKKCGSMAEQIVKVSIIIPIKNEYKNLKKLIPRILKQKLSLNSYTLSPELIFIDSGSTDGTLSLIEELRRNNNSVILKKLSTFHHSLTRNLGALLAKGEILVFLNADAIPLDDNWLRNLVRPILYNKLVVASFSRQVPPINLHFETARMLLSYPNKSHIISKKNFLEYLSSYGVLFSTVSGAIVRSIFISEGMFNRSIPINEDQEFALRLIKRGYRIAYVAESKVLHAHFESYTGLFKRYFNFGRGWKKIYNLHSGFDMPFQGDLIKKLLRMMDILNIVQRKSGGNPFKVPTALFLGLLLSGLGFVLGQKL